MTNVINKSLQIIFNEFESGITKEDKNEVLGSGDLKYHLGTEETLTINDKKVK